MKIELSAEAVEALGSMADHQGMADEFVSELVAKEADAMNRLGRLLAERAKTRRPVPEGATHVVFKARAGDTATSPTHVSNADPVGDWSDEGLFVEADLDDMANEYMSESVRPSAWWLFLDADGSEVEG